MHLRVAVCTRGRPLQLQACLKSLFAMRPPPGARLELLVVENGDGVSPQTRSALTAAPPPWRASAVAEPTLGIPFARNRAIDAALASDADALVFVDDDQTVPPDWLATLLDVWRETSADAVQSAVRYVFETPGPYNDYVAGGSLREDGADVVDARFLATHGVVITRRLIEEWGLRFDVRAPLAGGSDTRFFLDATARGAKLVVTNRTTANEHCPPEKQRLRWILRRQRRLGYVQVVRGVKERSRARWLRSGCWRIVRGTLALPIIGLYRPARIRELSRIAKGAGILQGLLGQEIREYAEIYGR